MASLREPMVIGDDALASSSGDIFEVGRSTDTFGIMTLVSIRAFAGCRRLPEQAGR